MTRETAKVNQTRLKITYNGLRIIWILIYLVYMFLFGFTSYETINQSLVDRTTYIVNLFDTLYNQNAIQMVSNPENFKRVLVSDIEGEILLQYGELIPALTNLEYNTLFHKLETDKIVLSDFYYDPLIEDVCFDMGIIEKNRVYIGTLSAKDFLKDNLENLKLDHFLIFDNLHNGYIYKNSKISSVNYYDKEQINWLNRTLFLSDSKIFLGHWETLNNFRYLTYIPFMKIVFPIFLYALLPFVFGLLIIFLIESMEKNEGERKRMEIENQLLLILKNNRVPKPLQTSQGNLYHVLFKRLDDMFADYEKNKSATKRYVTKLSTYAEQVLEMKNDLEYLEKYFYNLMNQEDLDFSKSILTLFKVIFEKTHTYHSLTLKINNQTIYSKEDEADCAQTATDEKKTRFSLDLGRYKLQYVVDLDPKEASEFSAIRKSLFELLVRYIAHIYSVKHGFNPAELNMTKNFSIFSEMVNHEIEKVKRYSEKGMLLYLEISNYSLIKDKYGMSVAKIILKRLSEIIISKIRTSDIIGIYREGAFLVYFCNLEENNAKIKIQNINNNIYKDVKIQQIGINIELRNSMVSVDSRIKDFDDLLLKCLQTEKK